MRARDILELVRSGQTCIVDVQNAKISFTETLSNSPIAFKVYNVYTEVKYLKLHENNCQWLD